MDLRTDEAVPRVKVWPRLKKKKKMSNSDTGFKTKEPLENARCVFGVDFEEI